MKRNTLWLCKLSSDAKSSFWNVWLTFFIDADLSKLLGESESLLMVAVSGAAVVVVTRLPALAIFSKKATLKVWLVEPTSPITTGSLS